MEFRTVVDVEDPGFRIGVGEEIHWQEVPGGEVPCHGESLWRDV